jgi:uncharacterized membrane protein YgaE (UPF0421/DUF939 family)
MGAEMKLPSWRRSSLIGDTSLRANKPELKQGRSERQWRQWFGHSARTALAAVLSLYAARALGFPEAYWASISTLIVMQSTLGATFATSMRTFVGTALGCGFAILLARYFGPNGTVFGAAVFGLGLLCSLLCLDKTAYRFAGITLTVVMLTAGKRPIWIVGAHRFVEVSVGIAFGLMFTALWPEAELPETSIHLEGVSRDLPGQPGFEQPRLGTSIAMMDKALRKLEPK